MSQSPATPSSLAPALSENSDVFEQHSLPFVSPSPAPCSHDWQSFGYDKRGRVVLGCYHCRAFLRGLSPPEPRDRRPP